MQTWVYVNGLVGVWLVIAPFVLGSSGRAVWNDVIFGIVIIILSAIILKARSEAAAEAPAHARMGMREEMPMTASAMRDMAASLARMPDAQRKTMLKERLGMFAQMPDMERKRAMQAMMEGVMPLPDEDKKKLFRTRFEVLAELTEGQRSALMMTHMGVLQEMGQDMMRKEMELTQAIMPELSPNVRQMVQMMMSKMG